MGHFDGGMKYLDRQDNLIAFEDGAEYVFRFTRTALDAEIDNGYGALVRVYLGKIDLQTNAPEAGWADEPVYEEYAWHDRNSTSSICGISVETGGINNKFTDMPHTLIISSNKYVGVKTVVNGEANVAKVQRFGEYIFPQIPTDENTVHVGWTQGAESYNAEEYAAVGESKVIKYSVTYTPLTFGLAADKAASLRFRQRTQDGEILPVEASLKWNVTAEDTEDVISYFGGLKLGYKITAENGKTSGGVEVDNYLQSGNAYAYAIIQSNIGEYVDMKFTCQAYVEFAGVKYYTQARDMETEGRSVAIVAERAVNDARAESTVVDGIAYSNAIVTVQGQTKYHYLTQAEYDLLASLI